MGQGHLAGRAARLGKRFICEHQCAGYQFAGTEPVNPGSFILRLFLKAFPVANREGFLFLAQPRAKDYNTDKSAQIAAVHLK